MLSEMDKEHVREILSGLPDEALSRLCVIIDAKGEHGDETSSSVGLTGEVNPVMLAIVAIRALHAVVEAIDDNFPDASEDMRSFITAALPDILAEESSSE